MHFLINSRFASLEFGDIFETGDLRFLSVETFWTFKFLKCVVDK